MEDDGPYRLARFYDSGTKQPFLAESAVYDENVQEYVAGINADLTFKEFLKTRQRKLLPGMGRGAAYFKKHGLKPQQARLLADFGQAWRAGVIPLDTADIDELIKLGYLVRDSGLSSNEIAALESAARTIPRSDGKT